MKTIIKAVFILLMGCLNVFNSACQTKENNKQNLDSIFEAKFKVLQSKMDSSKYFRNAVLIIQKINKDSIFYSNLEEKTNAYLFDSALFKICKGRMTETYFFLKDTNKSKSVILFIGNGTFPVDKLKIINKISSYRLRSFINSSEQIKLSDYFLIYPNINIKGNDYYPSDTVVTFKKNDRGNIRQIYFTQSKLENSIEFDMLSDIQGLSKNNPNGLIQFEGRANLTLNRQYLSNSNLRICYNIIPFIQFNKVDQNNRDLPILIDTFKNASQKNVNTVNLWQYSNLTFGTKLNVVRWDSYNGRNSLFIDFSSMIIRTSIIDSTPKLISKNVYSFIWGTSLKFRARPLNYIPFWGDFSIGLHSLTLLDPTIKQQSTHMYQQNQGNLISGRVNGFWDKFLMVPQIELFIIQSGTKYFVRGVFPTDFTKAGNSFFQIQFGLSISPKELNNFLNVKGNK